MSYIGDYTEDFATLNFKFTTVATTGAPTTLSGTPVISVYKANGLTQSVAGITLTVDFDAVTGLNNVLIDLSADVFYAVANDYQVVITTGTVGGTSVVGYVVAEFSIENRFMRGTDNAPSAAVIADAVWDEAKSGHVSAGSFGEEEQAHALSSEITALNDPSAAVIADAVWDEAKAGHVAAGSFGEEQQAHALSSEISALNDLSAANVNTEVSDVLKTDTVAEMSQQAPPTTPTLEEAIMYLYMALVHKVDITATLKEFHNDAGAVIWKKALSDDATTYTEAESASGP